MLKKVLIILLGIIIVFMLFGRERVIFNLDKIRTEYIDDSLSVTIVGTSLSKWSHKFGFDLPTNNDFSNQKIILPELACNTDISLGHFCLRILKE